MMFLASLLILLPVVSASSVGAKDVQITNEYVKATSLCTCGSYGYDNFMTTSFVNYCPRCNSYETLKFNPKGTPEGEWTCTKCGSDYCAACGKEKISGSKYYLIKYNGSDNNTKTGNTTEVHAQMVTSVSVENQLIDQIIVYNGRSFLKG
jgi:hypothetical protein